MALHAIHTTCDVCGVGSANYEAFPLCRDCLTQVCPAHAAPGTEECDSESGTLRWVTCLRCDQADAGARLLEIKSEMTRLNRRGRAGMV